MNISKYALLAIDLQEDFREDTEDFPGFENSIRELFTYCRNSDIQIIHINGLFKNDKSNWMNWTKLREKTVLLEGSGGEKRFPYAQSVKDEKEIEKHSFDGFIGTDLEFYLKNTNVKCLFICGLITSVCVLLTAITAVQKGYLVSVISDCVSDNKATHDFILGEYDYLINPIKRNEIEDRIAKMEVELAKLGI